MIILFRKLSVGAAFDSHKAQELVVLFFKWVNIGEFIQYVKKYVPEYFNRHYGIDTGEIILIKA